MKSINIKLAQIKNLSKRTIILSLGVIVAAFPALASPFLAFAISDTQAPTVTDMVLTSENTIDVSNPGGAAIRLSGHFTDDLSGFYNAIITYTSQSGKQVQRAGFNQQEDGSYATAIIVPQYGETGAWTPSLYTQDSTGNYKNYSDADLHNRGINLGVTVSSSQSDTHAPTITDLALTSENSIDVSNNSAAVYMNGHFTDDLSGFNYADITFTSPSGAHVTRGGFSQNEDGSYSTSALVNQYGETGTWTATALETGDNASNIKIYSAPDLAPYSLSFNVTSSQSDTSAPTAANLKFSVAHPAVEAPFAGAVITLTSNFSDNLTGVGNATITYTSPSGGQKAYGAFSLMPDGSTYQGSVTIPPYGESGTWTPELTLQDNADNSKTYSSTELANQGFSLLFSVFKSAAQNLPAGGTLTSDVEGDGATAIDPVEATVTTPTGGNTSISMIDSDAITDSTNGYTFVGRQISIVAPTETIANPLSIIFRIDSSKIPAGQNETTFQIVKNGAILPACADATTANPDACVYSRQKLADGDIEVKIHSTTASVWTGGFPTQTLPPKFDFKGFLGLNNPPLVNKAAAGLTIPMAFSLGSNKGLNILASNSPSSQQVDCNTKAILGSSQSAASALKQGLVYVPIAKTYGYAWKTNPAWKNTCRQFNLTLTDGSTHSALFKFN